VNIHETHKPHGFAARWVEKKQVSRTENSIPLYREINPTRRPHGTKEKLNYTISSLRGDDLKQAS
jgi:hypothetical protein